MIIRNARIPNYETNTWIDTDLLIEEGIIKKIGDIEHKIGDLEFDSKGLHCLPGFIDPHVHLREPGFEFKETIETGTKACARGGYTHVFAMPNTNPVPDNVKNVTLIKQIIKDKAIIDVSIVGAVTESLNTNQLAKLESLAKEGVIGFSNDGHPVYGEEEIIKALEISKLINLPIMTHDEDKSLFEIGGVNRGKVSKYLNLDGIPKEAEYMMIHRDIELMKKYGGKLHICHISTKESVALVRRAKRLGLEITCEVTPHHFSLTEDIVIEKGTMAKVNPPLRTKTDLKNIIAGIKDSTIDVIATDHAPHEIESKMMPMGKASYGISGIETAFAISYTNLVLKGHIDLIKLSKMLSFESAKIFSLINEGNIKEGYKANLTFVDLQKEWKIDTNDFISMGRNTPFKGMKVKSDIVATIYKGKFVFGGL